MFPTSTKKAETEPKLLARLRAATSSSPCRAARLPAGLRFPARTRAPRARAPRCALPRAGRSGCRGSAPAPARRRRGRRRGAARSAVVGAEVAGVARPARPRARPIWRRSSWRTSIASLSSPGSGRPGARGAAGASPPASPGMLAQAIATIARSRGPRPASLARRSASAAISSSSGRGLDAVGDEGALALAADHQALGLEPLVDRPHGVEVDPRPLGQAAEARQPLAARPAGRWRSAPAGARSAAARPAARRWDRSRRGWARPARRRPAVPSADTVVPTTVLVNWHSRAPWPTPAASPPPGLRAADQSRCGEITPQRPEAQRPPPASRNSP